VTNVPGTIPDSRWRMDACSMAPLCTQSPVSRPVCAMARIEVRKPVCKAAAPAAQLPKSAGRELP